jgi:hypothetical protein
MNSLFSVFFGTSTDMYKKFGAPRMCSRKIGSKKIISFKKTFKALAKPQPVHTCTVGGH